MTEETIWVITEDSGSNSDSTRGYREVLQGEAVKISVDEMEQKMSHFLRSVSRIFQYADQCKAQFSDIALDEIELSIEISGEGEIKLLGSGGKTGGKGAIKLKFKRSN
jgi:uncharacterized membrane protein YheB (UPF0754 family)